MRYHSIDIMRGIAASAVAFAHVDPRFRVGAIGVDIFFVISGFVMAHACQQRTPAQFIADRLWRIYPTYWAVAVPWIVAGLVMGAASPAVAVNSLLLLPQWFGLDSSFIGVSWTLVYELAFYAAVAAAMQLRNVIVPMLLFAGALAARPLSDHPLIEFAGHPIAVEFLFGFLIARSTRNVLTGRVLLAVGLVWLLIFPNAQLHDFLRNSGDIYGLQRLFLWGVPAALMVYGVASHEKILSGQLWTRPFLLLGAASYSIYLVHSIVVALVDAPWFVEWLLSLATGIAVWRLLEQPVLDYRARLRRAMQDAPLPNALAAN